MQRVTLWATWRLSHDTLQLHFFHCVKLHLAWQEMKGTAIPSVFLLDTDVTTRKNSGGANEMLCKHSQPKNARVNWISLSVWEDLRLCPCQPVAGPQIFCLGDKSMVQSLECVLFLWVEIMPLTNRCRGEQSQTKMACMADSLIQMSRSFTCL